MLDTILYNNLKFCWREGYKLTKIKEYLDTDISLEDIQSAFMVMWECELKKIKESL